MSRTKDRYWPDEGRTPRPPAPIKHAIRAAWREFWRDLKAQQRLAEFRDSPDPFKETT